MALPHLMRVLVCSIGLFAWLASPAAGQVVYHVSPNGKDGNPGTAADPFRTLAHALGAAMTGAPAQVVLKMEQGDYATPGVDVAANYARLGIGDGTSLHIEGGYDANFSRRVGVSRFTPSGLGSVSNALEINLAARQELRISRLMVRGTGGVGLRVTSNPSGATLPEQASADVLIQDCAFVANFIGVSVAMSIGPNGGNTATTTFRMIDSEIVNNSERGLVVGGVTDFNLKDVSIRGNGNPTGVGLVLGSTDLREGLIEDTEIINNHAGMELINLGTAAPAAATGLRLRRMTLANNRAPSLVDNVRRLRFEMGTVGHNPALIKERTISTEGELTIENLRIEPYGTLAPAHWLAFENVGSSGLHYTVQDTDTALGPEIRVIVTDTNTDARVIFEGTDADDRILSRPIGAHAAFEIMLASNPSVVASRMRVVPGAVALNNLQLGNFTILGGAGVDHITVQATRLPLFVDGGTGNDQLEFEDNASINLNQVGHVHLYGGPGNDVLTANTRSGLQRVIMEGGPGNNSAIGGDGDELIIWRSGHGPILPMNGGGGTDTMRFVYGTSLNDPIVVQRNPGSPTLLTVIGGFTYSVGAANNINHVEVHTESFPNSVETGHLPTWLESLRIVANELPLEATVQAFVPTSPSGTLQSIWVLAAEGFEADSHIAIHGVAGETSRFDTQPLGVDSLGNYTPGWVAVRTSGSSPLNVYNQNMSTITMFGKGGDDLFVPQFWPISTQILEGGPGTDRILMASSQQPYTATIDGAYTVLTRENFAPIRYTSIEIEDINPVTPPALPGDVNGDGVVNVADVTMLARHLLHGGPLLAPGNADVNDDGEIDMNDLDELVDMIVN